MKGEEVKDAGERGEVTQRGREAEARRKWGAALRASRLAHKNTDLIAECERLLRWVKGRGGCESSKAGGGLTLISSGSS